MLMSPLDRQSLAAGLRPCRVHSQLLSCLYSDALGNYWETEFEGNGVYSSSEKLQNPVNAISHFFTVVSVLALSVTYFHS